MHKLCEKKLLFIKIKPSLLKYLEKIGIFFSSSFKINTDPLNKYVKKKVSHADWWLLVIKKGPFLGIFLTNQNMKIFQMNS